MKVGDYKGGKVREADFWKKKKNLIWRYSRESLQISAGWLVGNTNFSEMALRIFLIFYMKLGDYKGRKVTEAQFLKKTWFGDIREKVSKLALVGWLDGNANFSETALRIFVIFAWS